MIELFKKITSNIAITFLFVNFLGKEKLCTALGNIHLFLLFVYKLYKRPKSHNLRSKNYCHVSRWLNQDSRCGCDALLIMVYAFYIFCVLRLPDNPIAKQGIWRGKDSFSCIFPQKASHFIRDLL